MGLGSYLRRSYAELPYRVGWGSRRSMIRTAKLNTSLGDIASRSRRSILLTAKAVLVACVLASCCAAWSAEVRVMISGGFSAAYRTLAPQFERGTGHTLATASGPSMGNTPEAIPNRIKRGEPVDVVIMVGSALNELIREGKVVADSRADLARSKIGVVVRTGAPKPDIASVEAFKRTLLAAK